MSAGQQLSNGVAANGAEPSPIKTRQTAKTLDGVHTEVVCQAFADRYLVLVTQLGKVGCLTQVSVPETIPLPPPLFAPASPDHALPSLPPPPPSLLLQPLLGVAPEEVYDAYAAQIGSIVVYGLGARPSRTQGHEEDDDDALGAGTGTGRKPVVVGLALKRLPGQESGARDRERSRFGNVMSMVLDCRVW